MDTTKENVERYTDGYWREFVENVNNGSNYFRYSEYLQLLDEMDSLAAERDAAIAERDQQNRLRQSAMKACLERSAERDALKALCVELVADIDERCDAMDFMGDDTAELLTRARTLTQ